ncbi:MAG: hypothetical protein ACJ8FM_18985 [Xanthobacteraceae bacterium]
MLCRSLPNDAGSIFRPRSAAPTLEQITAAMQRAAWAARERTRYPDRIAEVPLAPEDCAPADDGFWHMGWIGVSGESEDWEVHYNPETDEGRLRKKR